MKKFYLTKIRNLAICVMTILSLAIPMMTSAEADKSNYDYSKEITVLQSAGVLEQTEVSAAELSSVLTRAEFADFLAKLINARTEDSGVVFIDVATDNLYAKSINGLAKAGVASVPQDLKFNPDAAITYDEALTMVIRAAGYGVMAQTNGGYPTGYTYTASKLGIRNTVTDNDSITLGEGLKVIYDGATVGTYSADKITADGNYTFNVSDDTLLSIYRGIYLQSGKVYALNGSCIDNEHTADDSEMNIDGLIYNVDENMNLDYCLGNNVEFLFKKDAAKDSANLIYLEKESGDRELEISSKNIGVFNSESFTLEYSKSDESSKKISVSLPRSVNVVYNGRSNDSSIAQLLNNLNDGYNHGMVVLKDTDGNSGYDLMIIKCYTTIAAGGFSNNTIYDTLNANKSICLDDYENISIHTADGQAAKIHTAFPYIAEVAPSADNEKIDIIICSEKVSGKLTAINATNSTIAVEGEEYDVNEKYYAENANRLYLGTEYTIYLDSTGDVAYFTEGANNDYKIGYLLKAVAEPEAFGSVVKFRIYDHASDKFDTYTAADKISIDEIKYDSDKDSAKVLKAFPDLTGKITDNGGKVIPQIIRYKADESNVVSAIDTAALSSAEGEDNSLRRIKTIMWSNKVDYTGWQKRFDMSLVYNSSGTKLMSVPSLDEDGNITINNEKSSDVEKYFSNTIADITSDVTREMFGYNFDGTTAYADILVYVGSADTKSKNSMMFKEFGEGLGSDGMTTKTLIVNENGTEKTLNINQNTKIPDALTQGDIISVNQAADLSVTDIALMYDRETKKYMDGSNPYGDYGDIIYNLPGYFSGYGYRSVGRQLSRGWVYKKIGTFVQMTYVMGDASFDGLGYECMDLNGRAVVIYDSTARENNRISNGSVNDIVDYKSVGNNCSYLMVSSYNGQPGAVFIYK
jgi:hypothetical protein